ncbi:MAG: hypothetical protein M0T83_02950 [Nitrospiraceae bacterium]|nr:hypothetical protein [Nitrospiraceae bacterium]
MCGSLLPGKGVSQVMPSFAPLRVYRRDMADAFEEDVTLPERRRNLDAPSA